ncbi:MAG: ABC transporter ATP-binding protein [Pseudomonadota bacterium]
MNVDPLTTKIRNAFRMDRAVRFVWRASPGWTVASTVLIVVQGGLPLLTLYLVKLIIDAVSAMVFPGTLETPGVGDGFSSIVFYIGIAGGVGLLTAVIRFFADYVKKAQALTVTDYMYAVLHEKSVAVDLAYYESPAHRDTLHRAQREGPYRPTSIVNGLVLAGQSGASLVAIVWLLVVFNPALPLILLAAVVPGILMRLKYSDSYYSWQKMRTEDERKAYYYSWMMTDGGHARELRLFGLGGHFGAQFRKLRDTLRGEKLGFEKRRALGDLVAQSSATIAVFGSFIYIASGTVQGTITLGDMVMYFQAFQKGLTYLGALVEGVAALYEDNLFLSNFYEFMDVQPEIQDPEKPERVPDVIKSGVEVANITFRYQNCEKNVIENLNFYIRPGEIVALVGENGAGKSTIVKLLCRLYDPTGGMIKVDGTDIKRFKAVDYRKRISVVFQDYIRYFLTARENIWLGNVDLDPADAGIGRAAQKAGIGDYMKSLHSGLDTPLGRWLQGGEELSVGQWQMTALARAFFRDADLVILDEPASSLDVTTEFRVFEKFRELIKDKSALIISHRFSTVKMADNILLLHEGRVAEQGTHDALMALDGKYAALYRKQAGQYQNS